jgi:hypothetical protein
MSIGQSYAQSYVHQTTRPPLTQLLEASPYQAYVYSYPHKTSYRADRSTH